MLTSSETKTFQHPADALLQTDKTNSLLFQLCATLAMSTLVILHPVMAQSSIVLWTTITHPAHPQTLLFGSPGDRIIHRARVLEWRQKLLPELP